MKNKAPRKKILSIIVLVILVIIGLRVYLNKNKNSVVHEAAQSQFQKSSHPSGIYQLTKEKVVVSYLKKHHHLPDYYITKREARHRGWIASKGNLCDVLPGRAIGGDHFGNREGKLPRKKGREYYEADINYNCGRRNADRVIFSDDGLIFVTLNHYKTFHKE